MEHFRNTPVEKKQVVRTYERFSQIVSHLLQPNGRVLVISEWGGRSVKASFITSTSLGCPIELLLRETAVLFVALVLLRQFRAEILLHQFLGLRLGLYVTRCVAR